MKRLLWLPVAAAVLLASCDLGDDDERATTLSDGGGAEGMEGMVPEGFKMSALADDVVPQGDNDGVVFTFTLNGLPDDEWGTVLMMAGRAVLAGTNLGWKDEGTKNAIGFDKCEKLDDAADKNLFQTAKDTAFQVSINASDGVRISKMKKGELAEYMRYLPDRDMGNGLTVADWVAEFIEGAAKDGITFKTGSNTDYVMKGVAPAESNTIVDDSRPGVWLVDNTVEGDRDITRYTLNLNNHDIVPAKYVKTDADGRKYIDAADAQSKTTEPDFSGANIITYNPLQNGRRLKSRGVTVSCLMKWEDGSGINGWDVVLGFYGDTPPDYFVMGEGCSVNMERKEKWFGYVPGEDKRHGTGKEWPAGSEWHRVTATLWDDNKITNVAVWIDGVKEATAPMEGNPEGWTDTLFQQVASYVAIGCGTNWWPAGYVDRGTCITDIRIYDKKLTDAQIASEGAL